MPAALAPEPGREALIGPVTAAAETAGVQAGMRMGEALATCPGLVLIEQDPAAVEQEWEGVLRRLEDAGFAVESPSRASSPSRPAVSSGSTEGWGRHLRRRSPLSDLPGTHAQAQGDAVSSHWRRRAWRDPGRQ